MKLKTVCAWCNSFIEETNCSPTIASMAKSSKTNTMLTHSICERCAQRIENKNRPDTPKSTVKISFRIHTTNCHEAHLAFGRGLPHNKT